jgi:serine/threonine protein phosphatase 1
MKTFVIGDIHGAYKALLQCFERSGFDYNLDRLIALGDVCDGYSEVRQCIDELLKIKHCDFIIGNHDVWALDWALRGDKPEIWTKQGGENTMRSYGGSAMPKAHVDFLKNAHLWVEVDKKVFVHAGFDASLPMAKQGIQMLTWDRDLLYAAHKKYLVGGDHKFGTYEEIYVGHTTTESFHSMLPLHFCNVWALDTGAGWSGKLTIMDIDTHKYWQSDLTPELYGGTGR